jgi:hypothetical protein
MESSHENPMKFDQIMAILNLSRSNRLVIATGQYSPNSNSERTFFFSECSDKLKEVADVWLSQKTKADVLSNLSNFLLGSSSAMYSTRPVFVWAAKGNELYLWNNGTHVAKFTTQETHIKTGIFGTGKTYQNSSLSSVHAFLSKTWFKRGVSIKHKSGKNIQLAHSKELSALIDPTYDGFDVMCDASWVSDLARAIANTTGIPLAIDKELR